MDQRTKVLIYSAAAYMFLLMVPMVTESRKRKICTNRIGITYEIIEERDRMRLEYVNTKI